MAVVKVINSKASIGRAIKYITKEEKTEENLISGIECNPRTAVDEMKTTKEVWNKKDGRQYKHYVHSFAEGEKIEPQKAHEIALELCKDRFKGYECVIATHKDKGHIHSHIIVNSVNFENGYKLQQSKADLAEMKEHCNELCKQYGLSITEKGKTFEGKNREEMTSFNKDKYQLLLKADKGKVKSYVLDTAVAVLQSKDKAINKQDFINKMAEKGYKTKWQDNHKYITFTDKEGQKVRNSNIEKTFKVNVSREELEHEFKQNSGREEQRRTEPSIGEQTTGTQNRTEQQPISTTIVNNGSIKRYFVTEDEGIGIELDESREYGTETELKQLHNQLHEIRGFNKKFNPEEQRKIREDSERARQIAECKAQQLKTQQRPIKPKSKDHSL